MNNQRKSVKFGSAWNKVSKTTGNAYISASSVSGKDATAFVTKDKFGKETTVRLWAEIDGKEPVLVKSFSLVKVPEKKSDASPDYSMLLTIE